jgi:acyl transferase domain-containing protein
VILGSLVRMTVLVFPGQGSQWTGMAADLLDTSEVFAARLRRCADAIGAYVDWSVEDVLRQRAGAPSLDRVEVVQPVLFSVHLALAELWMANGLVPQAVIGQSQGEIAAACVSGALSLEDAALVIVARSQLFAEELVGRGGIASIGLPAHDVVPYLTRYEDRLEVAGIIGSRTVTVAGELEALKSLVAQLNHLGIAATVVPASIPSHCAFIEPLRERLATLLARVRPRPSHIPMYSTVTAEATGGDELTADYWYANARRPVLFDPAMRVLLAQGERVFVESSAHPVLTRAMSDTAADVGCPVVVTGTLRRGCCGPDQFRSALAAVPRQHAALVQSAA